MSKLFKNIHLPVRVTGIMVRLASIRQSHKTRPVGQSQTEEHSQAFGAYVYMPLSHRPDIDH
jgi:hypothetical protein